jgi:hypothetical protein
LQEVRQGKGREDPMTIENHDNEETVAQGINRINAAFFDDAGNRASGLCLEEIGLDGHGVANTLWRISALLKERAGDSGKLLRSANYHSAR